jgi:pimeloyl-ACP methyl ester carboxylesterase
MNPASRVAELVRVETADGLWLDGALTVAPRGSFPVDAFLLVHGTGSSFYAPGVLEEFAALAVAAGATALRINTRGHDGVASIPSRHGSVKGVATFETVSDCRHDLAAWISFLADRGCRRIALVGHSMGGVKAIYAAAQEPRPEICAIVGLSPPRFCFESFQSHPSGERFRTDYARASQLAAEGRGAELISVSQPLPLLITATGFVEKYGPENRYDWHRLVPQVTVPLLVFVGSASIAASPAFAGILDAPPVDSQGNAPSVRIVEGADINYRGYSEQLFQGAAAWLNGLPDGDIATSPPDSARNG